MNGSREDVTAKAADMLGQGKARAGQGSGGNRATVPFSSEAIGRTAAALFSLQQTNSPRWLNLATRRILSSRKPAMTGLALPASKS
jgi:hypothetical protein